MGKEFLTLTVKRGLDVVSLIVWNEVLELPDVAREGSKGVVNHVVWVGNGGVGFEFKSRWFDHGVAACRRG